MPLKPKKCCGKKVRLTPKNITKKCLFDHKGFKANPNIKGNQNVIPPKMANTAPIDKT